MRLLDDDFNRQGSNAGLSVPETDEVLYSDDSQQFASEEDSAQGASSSSSSNRNGLIAQAKRNIARGKAVAQNTVPKKLGEALGDKQMFADNSSEGQERAKEKVKQIARDKAKKEIGKHITDEGIKQGFEKGLSKGAKSLAKEGAQKAGKAVADVGAKAGAQVAGKAATAAATSAVDLAGAATGVETFGLGFILAFLLNIAISLGVSDAVDSLFELKDGNFRQAKFLAIRGAAKVGMFIYILICLIFAVSIGGIFIAVPLIFLLNVYMVLGFAFKNIAEFQGLVWWEIALVIFIDIMAFLIVLAFVTAIGWYLCGGTGVASVGATIYSWFGDPNSTTGVAVQICKFIHTAAK